MGKVVFDHSTGKPIFALDDTTAIDDSGNVFLRVSDDMAASYGTGDVHFISDWDSEGSEDNDFDFESDI